MANRTTRTPEKDAQFLQSLMQGASVSTAAIGADYGRQRLYEWREADKEFAEAWDDALEVGTDLLEDEVLPSAKNGTAEPRFYEGQVCAIGA